MLAYNSFNPGPLDDTLSMPLFHIIPVHIIPNWNGCSLSKNVKKLKQGAFMTTIGMEEEKIKHNFNTINYS